MCGWRLNLLYEGHPAFESLATGAAVHHCVCVCVMLRVFRAGMRSNTASCVRRQAR